MGGSKKKLRQELPKLKWGLIQYKKNAMLLLNQLRKQEVAIKDICAHNYKSGLSQKISFFIFYVPSI